MTPLQLDAIDQLIIKHLTADARIPFKQLAEKIEVSNTLVHQRVQKMRDMGLLTSATFILDPWLLGYTTSAYTQIMLSDAKQHRRVEEELAKIPQIVECVNISGRYALATKIFAKHNRELRDIIYEQIHPIDGVEGTNTTISFETAFRRNPPIITE